MSADNLNVCLSPITRLPGANEGSRHVIPRQWELVLVGR